MNNLDPKGEFNFILQELKATNQNNQLKKMRENQKAIKCLEDVVKHIKEKEFACYEAGSYCCYSGELIGHIYTKISELKGE